MRFGKKNRYLVKSLYFGPNPLVNEVILRFSAFRFNFLYKGWGAIAKLKKSKNYLSDLGITWVSCSGIHPEAITHFIPKSVKSTSQHLGSTPSTPCLRYYQQSKEKDWSDLGATWVKCSGIHTEAIDQLIPKSVKSTSQH